MTLIVERSTDHITRDGLTGCYCTLIDGLTGNFVGQFEVVFLAGGGQRYRSMAGTPYPVGLDLMGATRHSLAEHAGVEAPAAA